MAARTNGAFGMMEEFEGKFMLQFAAIVDGGNPKLIAPATLKFARDCISNIATGLLDADVMAKLQQGKAVSHLRRRGAERQLTLLSGLLSDASPTRVLETLQAIGEMPAGRRHRREAWQDTLKALALAAVGDVTVTEALVRSRNRARIIGRAAEQRVISRPLLIKGLEYNHAIVLHPERLNATELYVALSRGRDSLTVVSENRYLSPAAPLL